eukprot:1238641-Amphidinium_carterae.1
MTLNPHRHNSLTIQRLYLTQLYSSVSTCFPLALKSSQMSISTSSQNHMFPVPHLPSNCKAKAGRLQSPCFPFIPAHPLPIVNAKLQSYNAGPALGRNLLHPPNFPQTFLTLKGKRGLVVAWWFSFPMGHCGPSMQVIHAGEDACGQCNDQTNPPLT